MKRKFLLLASVALGAFAMSAVEEDITPKGYDFNSLTEFNYHATAFTGANIPTPVMTNLGGAENFGNGICAVAGGQFANPAQPYFADLKAGTSIVDLGGQVGRVFCISGVNSNINAKLKELYDVEMNIPSCTGGLNWFNLNWLTDPNNTPVETPIRVRVVMNIYSNQLSETAEVMTKAYGVADQGGVRPTGDNSTAGNAITSGNFCQVYDDGSGDPVEDDNGNLIWDPTRWLVYEFDMDCPKSEETTDFFPLRVKMEFTAGPLASSTVFIKEIKFTAMPDLAEGDSYSAKRVRSYQTLTLDPKPISSVQSLSANAALSCRVNGNNVTFSENAKVYSVSGAQVANAEAGCSVNLAKGVYVAKSANKSVKLVVR